MPPENETLDHYVTNSFNTINLNPAYIFILPDKSNLTLVIRKNDFLEIDYPNISHINKFKKMKKDFFNKKQENEMQEKLMENLYSDDSESMEMVDENMRTERNFYKWVEDYNNDVESFTKRPNKKKSFQNRKSEEDYELYDDEYNDDYETVSEEKEKSEEGDSVLWDDFGLKGWTGGLKKVREEYKTDIERYYNILGIYKIFIYNLFYFQTRTSSCS